MIDRVMAKKTTPRKSAAPVDEKIAGVTTATVKEKTGKSWKQWFAVMDRKKCHELTHPEIVAYLRNGRDVSHWWAQTITVGYEQARGLREEHQKCDGAYEANGSKTVGVPLARLYAAWKTKTARKSWLTDPGFEVRKATDQKSMRITWIDGETHVDAYFSAKGDNKSQVSLQHTKLRSEEERAEKKAYWKTQLQQLKVSLEG